MILTGPSIRAAMTDGAVRYDKHDGPWFPRVGPNSLDLHLGPFLSVYHVSWWRRLLGIPRTIDSRNPPPLVNLRKDWGPDGWGWLLRPGHLYLGTTWESFGTTAESGLVPMLDGRSSLARLGVTAHLAAGRGDTGFYGRWTVELTAAEPVVLYPGDRMFQAWFLLSSGPPDGYGGDYAGQLTPVASRGL